MPDEVHDVLVARWEGFKRLAKTLPNHHVLAVELVRTLDDQTVAVFTTVKNGEPVRSVVTADARGKVKPIDCQPPTADPKKAFAAPLEAKAALTNPVADPATVTLGVPPPHQPPEPGVIALAGLVLPTVFDVGELVEASS